MRKVKTLETEKEKIAFENIIYVIVILINNYY